MNLTGKIGTYLIVRIHTCTYSTLPALAYTCIYRTIYRTSRLLRYVPGILTGFNAYLHTYLPTSSEYLIQGLRVDHESFSLYYD